MNCCEMKHIFVLSFYSNGNPLRWFECVHIFVSIKLIKCYLYFISDSFSVAFMNLNIYFHLLLFFSSLQIHRTEKYVRSSIQWMIWLIAFANREYLYIHLLLERNQKWIDLCVQCFLSLSLITKIQGEKQRRNKNKCKNLNEKFSITNNIIISI